MIPNEGLRGSFAFNWRPQQPIPGLQAGDGISIVDNRISVSGVQDIAAGTNITIDRTDPHVPIISATGGGGGGGTVESVVAGTGIAVDNTDPANPVVSATGGGGSVLPFEGFMVHLAGDYTPTDPNGAIDYWEVDPGSFFSDRFYTSPNFDGTAYTVPTDGYYNIVFGGSESVYITINNSAQQGNQAEIGHTLNITMYCVADDKIRVCNVNGGVTFYKFNSDVLGGTDAIATYFGVTRVGTGSLLNAKSTTFMLAGCNASPFADGTYQYDQGSTSTFSEAAYLSNGAFVIKNLWVKTDAPPGTDQTVSITVVVDESDTALVTNVTGGGTTLAWNTTDQVTVNAGNLIGFKVGSSALAEATLLSFSVDYESLASLGNGYSISAPYTNISGGNTYYLGPNGAGTASSAGFMVASTCVFKGMVYSSDTAPGVGQSVQINVMQTGGPINLLTVTGSTTYANQDGFSLVINPGDVLYFRVVTSALCPNMNIRLAMHLN